MGDTPLRVAERAASGALGRRRPGRGDGDGEASSRALCPRDRAQRVAQGGSRDVTSCQHAPRFSLSLSLSIEIPSHMSLVGWHRRWSRAACAHTSDEEPCAQQQAPHFADTKAACAHSSFSPTISPTLSPLHLRPRQTVRAAASAERRSSLSALQTSNEAVISQVR